MSSERNAGGAGGPKDGVRVTFHLPRPVVEEARDAVMYLQTHDVPLTLAALVAEALEEKLLELRDRYNTGEPFPRRDRELSPGRPAPSRSA